MLCEPVNMKYTLDYITEGDELFRYSFTIPELFGLDSPLDLFDLYQSAEKFGVYDWSVCMQNECVLGHPLGDASADQVPMTQNK